MDSKRPPFPESDEVVSEIFQGIDATAGTVRDTTFEDCGFSNCRFGDTTFAGCKFVDCTFTACNLSNMNVDGTRFANVEFVECKVLGIDWTRATWPRVAAGALLQFRKSTLDDSTFMGLALEDMVIEDCKAHGVDFREAKLARATFNRTDFHGALFGKTDLADADFSGATGYAIDVFDNVIERARFSRDEALALLGSLGIELVD